MLTVTIDLMKTIARISQAHVLKMISHVQMDNVYQLVDVVMVLVIVMIILMKEGALVS